MNKRKYIHIKKKHRRNNYSGNSGRKPKHRPMCIEDYENLPKHEPLRSKNYSSREYHYDVTRIDFYTPLKNYLKEKVGDCFDDIYSDIIKKTMPKYRHLLDETLDWFIEKVSYYEKGVPFRTDCNYSYNYPDRFIILNYYVDYDGLLQKFNSKEELFTYAKNKYRQKKLERLLDECDE